MDDLIRRQDALDTIDRYYCNSMRMRSAIQFLPSAETERKKGKWIQNKQYEDRYKCSSCGREAWFPRRMSVFIEDYNFCPNCGSRNEVQKGEQNG